MTLNEIVVAALKQEERGHDVQVVEKYKGKFRQYANEAVIDLAKTFKTYRTDTVTISDNVLELDQLSRSCVKIISITQEGRRVMFDAGDSSGEVLVGADGAVKVRYEYIPADLSSDTDSPDIPEYLHHLIVLFVIARFRSSGDAGAQSSAGAFFQLYASGKRELVHHRGTASNYALTNIY